MITGLDRGDAFADRFHDATCLVAEDAGEEPFGVVAVEGVDVSVAESIRDDFYPYFASKGRVDGDGFKGERLFGCSGHHGLAGDWFANSTHCS